MSHTSIRVTGENPPVKPSASYSLEPTTHDEKRTRVGEHCLGELLKRLVSMQYLTDLGRELVKAIDNLVTTLGKRNTIFRHLDGEHDEGNILRCVRLGRSNANFRPSVDVDTTVGLAGDGRADGIDDTQTKRATFQAISHCEDGVRRFSRL